MDILGLLYQLFIMPLQIVFEEIFYFAFYLTQNPGIAIAVFSFLMSLLLLPLYNRADAIQKEEREIEAKLTKGVEHIKKTFRGDEQLMMLQTYYRKNNYSPLYLLRGSLSLFLQIPFFIAAYQFLSNLDLLNGVSFGFIKDLAAPDALFNVGGMSVNVLPIIMTVVNLVSTYLFTKGSSLKTKIQLYAMALFFLVFLYNSPSGLVFYWTCNNIFNLVKCILGKLENHRKGKHIVLGICSIIIFFYGIFNANELNLRKVLQILFYALLPNLPLLIAKFGRNNFYHVRDSKLTSKRKFFVVSACFIAILVGGLIPSAVIVASPQEFIVGNYLIDPSKYLLSTLVVSFGTFVIWLGVFYCIADNENKVLFERIIWTYCVVAIVNYMFFGKDLGLMTPTLEYERGMVFSKFESYLNIVVILLAIIISNFVWKRYRNYLNDVLLICTMALVCMISINIIDIKESIEKVSINSYEINDKILRLSRSGKNIIVFMLDRAIGLYVPYIFNEKPVMKEKFAGFTYYANTMSFGGYTNFTTPSLFGGYEYTPVEMNKRNNESLKDKHNEAIKVMPVLFNKNNYNVIVCDPSYANYQMVPDISLYDEYPNIKKYRTLGKFGCQIEKMDIESENVNSVKMNSRNFYVFGVMKSLPVSIQKRIYNSGQYNVLRKDLQNQKMTSLYTAKHSSKNFMQRYNVLKNLSNITGVDDNGNNFIIIVNHTTHEPCLLQTPDYLPSIDVNNYEYEKKHSDRFVYNGRKLKMTEYRQMSHYHANMASLIQLGNWFDYMRENNVYDNTRIIVVADHGRALKQVDEFILDDGTDYMADIQHYYPLFMVKDFNEKDFKISDEFMTNADVATIVTKDIIENPINPFTGNLINNTTKLDGKQYVLSSAECNVTTNNGNVFLPGKWYSVHTDMRDKNNWELVKENDVLPY